MVSFPSNHYNKLYIITIGDYTEQGYKRKKEKLEAEFEMAVQQSDPLVQVQSDAKKLSVVTQESTQMSETIAKLFKKPASAPKSLSLSKPAKGKSVAKAQKPVLKVLETVVVPERTTTIPQRNAREVLQKKGYIKMIRVEKRDSEPTVRNKVHEAFPLVFFKRRINSIPIFVCKVEVTCRCCTSRFRICYMDRGRCHCFSWTGMLVCVTVAFKC